MKSFKKKLIQQLEFFHEQRSWYVSGMVPSNVHDEAINKIIQLIHNEWCSRREKLEEEGMPKVSAAIHVMNKMTTECGGSV